MYYIVWMKFSVLMSTTFMYHVTSCSDISLNFFF